MNQSCLLRQSAGAHRRVIFTFRKACLSLIDIAQAVLVRLLGVL